MNPALKAEDGPALTWTEWPSLPDVVGFGGSFAGASGGALVVAGGANFPGKPPWEGGTKVWTDRVFVLANPNGPWRELAEKLPRPLGYGISITTDEGLVCLGGSDAEGHYADAFLLKYSAGTLTRTELPRLPAPCANACGAKVGNVIYVAGGLEAPNATRTLRTFWSLDLSRPGAERRWEVREPWPGRPRMLAVAAAWQASFFLFSGTDLATGADGKPVRTYLRDAYRYTPGSGWEPIAGLPRATVAAPTPAATGAGRIFVFSGDDGEKVLLTQQQHTGFPDEVLAYQPRANTWAYAGKTPAPFVTTALVPWPGGFVTPGGEIRPGTRSKRVFFAAATPEPDRTSYSRIGLVGVLGGFLILVLLGRWSRLRSAA